MYLRQLEIHPISKDDFDFLIMGLFLMFERYVQEYLSLRISLKYLLVKFH